MEIGTNDRNSGLLKEVKTKGRCAVLVIGFNRPDAMRKILEAVKRYEPSRLYIAIDGPRKGVPVDGSLVSECHRVHLEFDWKCQPATLFREQNLGCRKGVASAISWFFEHEDEGIILEDDCCPSGSFFYFCEAMLECHRDNPIIGQISGTTFLQGPWSDEGSYFYTSVPQIWGWATWKRAWLHYDETILLRTKQEMKTLFLNHSRGNRWFARHWTRIWKDLAQSRLDTWDFIWAFSFWRARMLSINPSVSLVENIGFSISATHTRKRPLIRAFRPLASEMAAPFRNPSSSLPNWKHEQLMDLLWAGIHGKALRSVYRLVWGGAQLVLIPFKNRISRQ